MERLSDELILDLILKDGKEEAGFRMLMEKYQERLYWHIRRLVIHHEDADDVLQNTMIKVFRSLAKFEGKSKLYTWLYRIATNESLTLISKRKKKLAFSIDNAENDLAQRLKADEFFDHSKINVLLQKAIGLLPEKQRLVFQMRYYDEMSYADIAESTGTSEGGLKASYHHAAKKIEQYLKTSIDE